MEITTKKLSVDDVFTLKLYSGISYPNAYEDVKLSVVFEGPLQESIEIPAQCKQDHWLVRFKPNRVGFWSFHTLCSDSTNTDLAGRRGTFEVTAPLERKIFAVGSPWEDAADQILEAIAAASRYTEKTGFYAEILLEKDAVYRVGVDHGTDQSYHLKIQKTRNIRLNGQGARFVFTNPSANGILVDHCENIILTNFFVDYDPLPYATGTITDIDTDKETYDLKLAEDSIEFDHPVFTVSRGNSGITKRPSGESARYGPVMVTAGDFQKIGDRHWRLDHSTASFNGYHDPVRSLCVGDRYSHLAGTWGPAVGITHSENVLCESVTLYSSPGLSFFALTDECLTFRNCHVIPRDSNRGVSTNADGMHLRSLRGFLVVDHCSFEGMPDDGINIHSSAMVLAEIHSDREVTVPKHTFDVREKDRMVVMNNALGITKDQITVASVTDQGSTLKITFNKPVANMVSRKESEIPDKLYNLDSCGTSFVIRHCVFNAHRCRDILLSTRFGIIEHNIFRSEEGWSVVLFHETQRWNEGPIAADVAIRNNCFEGRPMAFQASIYGYVQLPDGQGETKGHEIRNIRIEDNTFLGVGKILDLAGAAKVSLQNNIVDNPDPFKQYTASYTTASFRHCEDVSIDNLVVKDKDPHRAGAIGVYQTIRENEEEGIRIKGLQDTSI
jgi:hypothetical protein